VSECLHPFEPAVEGVTFTCGNCGKQWVWLPGGGGWTSIVDRVEPIGYGEQARDALPGMHDVESLAVFSKTIQDTMIQAVNEAVAHAKAAQRANEATFAEDAELLEAVAELLWQARHQDTHPEATERLAREIIALVRTYNQ